MTLSRRQLMKMLAAGVTLGPLGLTGIEDLTASLAMGGATPLRDLWSSDTAKLLRGAPMRRTAAGLWLTPKAMAQTGDKEISVVVIKVMNMIHTPLCFKLTPYSGSATNYTTQWSNKIGDAAVNTHLMGRGVDTPSDNPRWAALKLNKWFSDILQTGLDESGQRPASIAATDVGPFPAASEVALQAMLSVNQTDMTLNHSFKNTTLPQSADLNKGGDLGFHMARNGIVRSPFGITVLNMGQNVESTDGIAQLTNRVLGNDLTRVIAEGQSVTSYVDLLRQSIGTGFIDDELLTDFDALAKTDTSLRAAMAGSRPELEARMASLAAIGTVETARHAMTNITGANNLQAADAGADTTATLEFVAQCLFVKRILDIPGKPLRNFSLVLNVIDLDTARLDSVTTDPGRKPYTYVEGMRQLAMGMNVLAHAIKAHPNLHVVVISEGGRAGDRGDNKVGHSFVMGPGGSGNLKDFLYADNTALQSGADSFNAEPNEGNANAGTTPNANAGAGLRVYSDGLVKNQGGSAANEFTTVASLLHGVVKHLEEKAGVTSTSSGLGNYVQLQKA